MDLEKNNIMMKYMAHARWEGSLKKGKGTLSTCGGAEKKMKNSLNNYFSEEQTMTTPEELLAATHAGCFTMAVCSNLTRKGFDPNLLNTEATVLVENMKIKCIHLSIKGLIKNIAEEDFIAVTKYEEQNCIISKALNVKISTDARLLI